MLFSPQILVRNPPKIVSAGAGNAFTLITSGSGVGNTVATTSALDTTGADLLVVSVSYYSGGNLGGPASAPVTDSKSNTWTGLSGRQGNISSGRIWYCRGGTVGSGHTFTLTASAAAIAVQAWSGSNASPFDVQNNNLATGTSVQPGSVTPTNNNSLIVSAGSPTDNTSSYSVDSGFTASSNVPFAGGSNEGLLMSYLKQNTAAAINPTFSWTTSAEAAAVIAVFKP